jgi:hypothetical protein
MPRYLCSSQTSPIIGKIDAQGFSQAAKVHGRLLGSAGSPHVVHVVDRATGERHVFRVDVHLESVAKATWVRDAAVSDESAGALSEPGR